MIFCGILGAVWHPTFQHILPNFLVSLDPFSMPTLAKILQDSPESPADHTPVATTPDQRPESPVNIDNDKHVQLAVATIQANLMSERKAAIHFDVPLVMQGHWPDLKLRYE
jgi:hypothetical protein